MIPSPIAGILHDKLKAAGFDIPGISIGRRDDKSTWQLHWTTPPTPQQETQAQAIIDNLDIEAETTKFHEEQGQARPDVFMKGIGRLLVAKGICTKQELKAAIKQEWDAVK